MDEIRRLDVDTRFERVNVRQGHGHGVCWIRVIERCADTEVERDQIGTTGKGLEIVAVDRVPKRAGIILEAEMLKLCPRNLKPVKVEATPRHGQAFELGCRVQYDRRWGFVHGERVGALQFQALEVRQVGASERQKTAERPRREMEREILHTGTKGEDLVVKMHKGMPRDKGPFRMVEKDGNREGFRAGKPEVHGKAL